MTERFADFIKTEQVKWAKVIKEAKVTAEGVAPTLPTKFGSTYSYPTFFAVRHLTHEVLTIVRFVSNYFRICLDFPAQPSRRPYQYECL